MHKGLVSGLLAGALLTPAIAFAYSSPGSPAGYVNDFANVLKSETITALDAELAAFNASTTNEIAVAIIPSMGGDYIENYAVRLFEEWGVGKASRDNGVLLLLSLEEREMRIEVGYGLEGALPDSTAASILGEMRPYLKDGDYDSAITVGVRSIESATQGEYVAESTESISFDWWWIFAIFFFVVQWVAAVLARSKSWWAGGIVGGFAGIFIEAIGFTLGFFGLITLGAIVLGLLLDYVVSHTYKAAKSSGTVPPWWAGGGGFGSGHGGGFGGFGGGSSGGGGASSSW
ncbi:MAG: TPM domain-containing protein [Candidatus Kaiserbacteria bacterium]|nr:MAG: TPM domain-containing protein [Candidatus Kaiserbacteria bacterium]